MDKLNLNSLVALAISIALVFGSGYYYGVKQIDEIQGFEPSSVILDRIKVENEVLRLQVVSDSAEIVHFTTLLDSAEKAKNTFKGKHDEKINVINRLDGDGLYNALAGLKR